MPLHRKEIAFDLDINKLGIFYKDYRTAYKDLQKIMTKEGFLHRQGSVYNSIKPISNNTVAVIIHNMCRQLPWLADCVKVIDITDIGKTHSLLSAVQNTCREYSDARAEWIKNISNLSEEEEEEEPENQR